MKRITVVIYAIVLVAPAAAQVPDFEDRAIPLGALVDNAESIYLLRIAEVERGNIVTFKKVAQLKGKPSDKQFRHNLTKRDEPSLLEWAKSGREAICFDCGKRMFCCLGNLWYSSLAPGDPAAPWEIAHIEDAYCRTYTGTVKRLREQIVAIVAGKETVITAAPPDPDYRFHEDGPLPRDWLHGRKGQVWRIKAGLKITRRSELATVGSPHFVGWGMGGEEIVPALIASLKEKDPCLRAEAIFDLGQLGPPAKAALPSLRAALGDEDVTVRTFAAEALLRIDPGNALSMPVLVQALKGPDTAVRCRTAGVLAELEAQGRPAAADLQKLLTEDGDVGVRSVAAYALGRLAMGAPSDDRWLPDAITALGKALREDRGRSVRWQVVPALLKFGPQAAAVKSAEAAALRDPDDYVAAISADVLARLGREAIPLLVQALRDRRCSAREAVIDCLADFGPAATAVVPVLRETLQASDAQLVFRAAAALVQIDPDKSTAAVVPALAGILPKKRTDPRPVLRLLAALGRETRPAAPAICDLLTSPDEFVRREAIRTLGMIQAGKECRASLWLVAREDEARSLRAEAAVALWHNGARRDVITMLRDMLQADEWSAGSRAPIALGEIGPGARDALPQLRRLMHSGGKLERARAALAYWRIAAPITSSGLVFDARQEALLLLADWAKEVTAQDRWGTIYALGEIGREEPAAVRLLVRLLSDSDPEVRQAATRRVGELGPLAATAVPALEKMLKDEDSANRRYAAEALWQIGHRGVRSSVLLGLLEHDPALILSIKDPVRALGPDAVRLVPRLRRLLRHTDRDVYKQAAALLRQIDPKAAESPEK